MANEHALTFSHQNKGKKKGLNWNHEGSGQEIGD